MWCAPEEFLMTQGWFVVMRERNGKRGETFFSVTLLLGLHISLPRGAQGTKNVPSPGSFTHPLHLYSLLSPSLSPPPPPPPPPPNFFLAQASSLDGDCFKFARSLSLKITLVGGNSSLGDLYDGQLWTVVVLYGSVPLNLEMRVILGWRRLEEGMSLTYEGESCTSSQGWTHSLKESERVCELFTLPFMVGLHQHTTSIELPPLTSGNQWQHFFPYFFSLPLSQLKKQPSSLLVCECSFLYEQCWFSHQLLERKFILDSKLQKRATHFPKVTILSLLPPPPLSVWVMLWKNLVKLAASKRL